MKKKKSKEESYQEKLNNMLALIITNVANSFVGKLKSKKILIPDKVNKMHPIEIHEWLMEDSPKYILSQYTHYCLERFTNNMCDPLKFKDLEQAYNECFDENRIMGDGITNRVKTNLKVPI